MSKEPLSKHHFEIFRAECERMIDVLHLRDWAFLYEFEKLDTGIRAEVSTDMFARTAIVSLARSWEPIGLDCLSDDKVRETARHEVLHVLMAPVDDRECDRMAIQGRIHAVINTLQGLLTEREKAQEQNEESD